MRGEKKQVISRHIDDYRRDINTEDETKSWRKQGTQQRVEPVPRSLSPEPEPTEKRPAPQRWIEHIDYTQGCRAKDIIKERKEER